MQAEPLLDQGTGGKKHVPARKGEECLRILHRRGQGFPTVSELEKKAVVKVKKKEKKR